MDFSLILKIAIVGIIISILNQILKQTGRDELAFLSSLAGIILVLFWLLPYLTELFVTIDRIISMVN
ncbi:MAG TPA: stage III sporulation protein AC [Clostridiales bacterium]|nr:stage III sporulation protein AC [Clostridiales bacterium]